MKNNNEMTSIQSEQKREPESKVENCNQDVEEDERPIFHWRTVLALFGIFLINFTQLATVIGTAYVTPSIGMDLNGTAVRTWIPNTIGLVQAVGAPLLSFFSDAFGVRKYTIVIPAVFAFVGTTFAARASNIYTVIGGAILQGIGLASAAVVYSIPSEVLPRRWRPLAQSLCQVASTLAGAATSIIGAAFIQSNGIGGWRDLYWYLSGLWAFTTVVIWISYNPPKRDMAIKHENFSTKIRALDLPGLSLFAIGQTLLLVGLGEGDNPLPWSNARALAPLIIGICFLIAFGIYEWKFTKVGVLHHQLFSSGPNFAICTLLLFIEGVVIFPQIVFYPILTSVAFESRVVIGAVRILPVFLTAVIGSALYGLWSSKTRTFRIPLVTGYFMFLIALIGFSTVQPTTTGNHSMVAFNAIIGLGYACPIVLVVALVQLTVPKELIATATAVVVSIRSVGTSASTAWNSAILTSKLQNYLPDYIAQAGLANGIAPANLPGFIGGLLSGSPAAVAAVPGVTPAAIESGVQALQQAYVDAVRYIWIIGACFAFVGIILAFFIREVNSTMNYHVDAPLEKLEYRHDHNHLESAHQHGERIDQMDPTTK